MEHQITAPLYIAGLSVITSNTDGASARDIPLLWERFQARDLAAELAIAAGADIYCIYTAYEGDHTRPYTTVLGYRMPEPSAHLPEGCMAIVIPPGRYRKFSVNSPVASGVVFRAWQDIWNTDICRAYLADFEVYNAVLLQQGIAKADIFVGLI